MNLQQAEKLWLTFLSTMNLYGDVTGHGNSGEFHEEKVFAECSKDFWKQLDYLESTFFEITGFVVYYKGRRDDHYEVTNPKRWIITKEVTYQLLKK